MLCCVRSVLGRLAPVHWCARSVHCVACAVYWATWRLFISVRAQSVVLRVRCPGPLGSFSPVCALAVVHCLCRVVADLVPVYRCRLAVWACACAVPWATWLLFTGVCARGVVLPARCPGPLGSCSPVCSLGSLCRVCSVLCHLTPVHRCARSVHCVACALSLATWLLFTGVRARCVVMRVRCPWPFGSCSPVCSLGALCRVCSVLGQMAPVDRCARSERCVACAVSWATWLLFTRVCARCVVLRVPCGGQLGSCLPVCPCAVSWATWLLFTGVRAWCVVLPARCSGPLGSCSPVCSLDPLCRVCSVLGHLAPVHWCARSVRFVAVALSWATWLLVSGVRPPCVVLRARCPWPLGSCSPVCSLGALCCVSGILGHLASVNRCARSVRPVACALSWATWLLFTGVRAPCVLLRVRCPGPLGSCSLVCSVGALCCVRGVVGHLDPVHRCARSVRCVACAVSWATWLLFTGVCARCVVLRVPCGGPLGSCSPVCRLTVLSCVCGVLGHLAPFHRCARSECLVACAVSWAT